MKNIILLISLALFSYMLFDANKYNIETDNARKSSSIKEKRKRIVVVDTGISAEHYPKAFICNDYGAFAFNNSNLTLDMHGHGTNVVGLIAENMNSKKYCITVLSVTAEISGDKYVSALRFIGSLENVIAVNLSLSNSGAQNNEELDMAEGIELKSLSDKGVKIFVAAGNDGIKLFKGCSVYPACHKPNIKNMVVIGNVNHSSNFGPLVDYVVDGNAVGTPILSGSSQSTAIYTGLMFSK